MGGGAAPIYIYIYCYHRSSVNIAFGVSRSELTKPGDQSMAGFDLIKKYYQNWWSEHGSTWFHQIINIKRGDLIVARVGVVNRWSRPGDQWVRKWRKTEWSNSWKNPGLLLTGLLIKLAILSKKKTRQFQEKKWKHLKSQKKKSKIQKIKKKLEKQQKTLKNTRKRKREWSGSEAGAKRQARKPWKTVKKHWNHRIRFVPAPLPLRSGSVPASSPWSLNATMIISMSRCQGLFLLKNHQKIHVVYQGQFTHQKNHHETLGVLTLPWSFQYIYIYVCVFFSVFRYFLYVCISFFFSLSFSLHKKL